MSSVAFATVGAAAFVVVEELVFVTDALFFASRASARRAAGAISLFRKNTFPDGRSVISSFGERSGATIVPFALGNAVVTVGLFALRSPRPLNMLAESAGSNVSSVPTDPFKNKSDAGFANSEPACEKRTASSNTAATA